MSLLLGSIIPEPIQIQTSNLIDILTQVKHYLTLQMSITLTDNQHCLTIASARKLFSSDSNNKNQFTIPKNFSYLFTHYQKIYVENQQDLEFFDVCYQCLMIVKEYLPSKVEIQVDIMQEMDECVGNSQLSLADFVQNFENQKNEEFLRRVNSNFKSLISNTSTPSSIHEVQNILYMAQNFYFYKNKLSALKYLAYNQHITKQVFAQIGNPSINFLKELSLDDDFRTYCEKIIEKIAVAKEMLLNQNDQDSSPQFQSSQNSHSKNYHNYNESDFINDIGSKSSFEAQKQLRLPDNKKFTTKTRQKDRSPLRLSSKQNKNINRLPQTVSKDDKLKNLSVKSLLFQLRQSQSLKRISMLIEAASQMKIEDQKYQNKVQKEIQSICRRFLKQSYLDRYQSNKKVLDHSQDKPSHSRQKNHLIDESFIATSQQVQEVSKFYQSLICYFSRKDSSLKLHRNQCQNVRDKNIKENKTLKEVSGKYRGLLQQICQKIQQKYYCR